MFYFSKPSKNHIKLKLFDFSTSAEATALSRFGSGNGNFLLDEVACRGIEDSIADCPHNGWKVHNCRSFEVAGVVCKAKKGLLLLLIVLLSQKFRNCVSPHPHPLPRHSHHGIGRHIGGYICAASSS